MKTISEEIREHLVPERFTPFTIFATDGRQFRIPTPAYAHVHSNRKFVSVYNERTLQCILPAHRISKFEIETEHSK